MGGSQPQAQTAGPPEKSWQNGTPPRAEISQPGGGQLPLRFQFQSALEISFCLRRTELDPEKPEPEGGHALCREGGERQADLWSQQSTQEEEGPPEDEEAVQAELERRIVGGEQRPRHAGRTERTQSEHAEGQRFSPACRPDAPGQETSQTLQSKRRRRREPSAA